MAKAAGMHSCAYDAEAGPYNLIEILEHHLTSLILTIAAFMLDVARQCNKCRFIFRSINRRDTISHFQFVTGQQRLIEEDQRPKSCTSQRTIPMVAKTIIR